MNAALEKMLRELAATHLFGSVEIFYVNGVPTTVHVKKTLKLVSTARTELNPTRETRGDNHGQPNNTR
jgi:hypothetical protein